MGDAMIRVPAEVRDRLAVIAEARGPSGIGGAIHAARHLPEWGADALVATVEPKAYEGRGLPVLDLNR